MGQVIRLVDEYPLQHKEQVSVHGRIPSPAHGASIRPLDEYSLQHMGQVMSTDEYPLQNTGQVLAHGRIPLQKNGTSFLLPTNTVSETW